MSKPKRTYNIRIDEDTYKVLLKEKKKTKRNIIEIAREKIFVPTLPF